MCSIQRAFLYSYHHIAHVAHHPKKNSRIQNVNSSHKNELDSKRATLRVKVQISYHHLLRFQRHYKHITETPCRTCKHTQYSIVKSYNVCFSVLFRFVLCCWCFFFSVVRCAFSQLAFFLLLNFFFLLLPSHLFSPKRHTTEAQSAGEALNMHCMLRAYFFLLLLISSNNGNELNGKGFTCVKRQHEMEQTVQCIHDWWHKNDCQMPNSMAFGNAECEWVRTLRTNGICIYVRWSLFCISENVHLVNNIIWWSIGTGVCSSDYEMCSSISWLV